MNNRNQKKVRRKTIALETKIAILSRLADGEGSTALGKEFKLGESTIRAIQKRASKINESNNCATNESGKRTSYSRNILIEKTEKALIFWIKDSTRKRIPIDGDLMKKKAKQYFNQLKDLEPSSSSLHFKNLKFSASNGWLSGFLRRHALHNEKIQGEATSTDETATKNYCKELAKIIDDDGYCPNQVFNADETGLFWKKMPSQTFIAKSEKTASDFKVAKDRITFLLCSNASSARMLKPLIVNKALYPHMLKDINLVECNEAVNDNDIINNIIDHEDKQEEPDSMTVDKIYAGIQLCSKLENHFLKIDNNSERSLKFQKELRSCISGYCDVYKQLIKPLSSQKLITDYMVTKN
ncbi:tigger transposable element-derived protein 1 [Megalopta genalis]|uniref:tigger transposable element-derived protein 1 n=1 Tax=Megalopta genalis TaxID=115081 RepID=UPI003FD4177F